MYITVIGGGNSTAVFAVLAKLAGHSVAVLTRKPEAWTRSLEVVNKDAGYCGGAPSLRAEVDVVTAAPEDCIPQSDMIFIAGVPIHHNPEILATRVAPHMARHKKVYVGTVCAYGGFNWLARSILGDGQYVVFGSQLIPWCCLTPSYGHVGAIIGAKRLLRIAYEDPADAVALQPVLQDILKIEDMRLTDFLASLLWPNNPVLHPPILYGLFKDWDGETPLPEASVPKLIYAELTTESAKVTEALDAEIVAIVEALRKYFPDNEYLKEDFHLRKCIVENYKSQVADPSTCASAIITCAAFVEHKLPLQTVAPSFVVPILKHKFFETDLPFGLCIFKDLALMLDVPTPVMDAIILWNQKLIGKEYMRDGTISGKDAAECVLPSRFGLTVTTLLKQPAASHK